jgi:hypothetical protein
MLPYAGPTNSGGGAPAPGEKGFIIGSIMIFTYFMERYTKLYILIPEFYQSVSKCTKVLYGQCQRSGVQGSGAAVQGFKGSGGSGVQGFRAAELRSDVQMFRRLGVQVRSWEL